MSQNYRQLIIVLSLFFMTSVNVCGQERRVSQGTPSFALKSNLLYDATASINLGAELKLGHKWTAELPVSFNPWTFNDNKKWKHIMLQPEVRWWSCEAFNGHFFGLHTHYAYYNVGNVNLGIKKMPDSVRLEELKEHRYEGWLAGAGLTYGYQFYLGKRFNVELALGLGWAYLHYDKFRCEKCGDKIKSDHKNYFGPTKAAISLVYLLK